MWVTALDEKKVALFYHEVNWTHFMDCAVTCAMGWTLAGTWTAERLTGLGLTNLLA